MVLGIILGGSSAMMGDFYRLMDEGLRGDRGNNCNIGGKQNTRFQCF
jgi:hypothetical protein